MYECTLKAEYVRNELCNNFVTNRAETMRNCEKCVNLPRKRGFLKLYAQKCAELMLETRYSRAFQSPTVEKR